VATTLRLGQSAVCRTNMAMRVLQRWNQTSLPNKLLVITGTLTAFGTLFYACAAILQFYVLKQSSEQTARQMDRFVVEADRISNSMQDAVARGKIAIEASAAQSKAALDSSIELARSEQRAWVGVTEVISPKGSTDRFGVWITNSGRTPARNVIAKATTQYQSKEARFVPAYIDISAHRSVSVIHPGMRVRVSTLATRGHLSAQEIDELNRGTHVLYIYGVITYVDAFGRSHWSKFCTVATGNLAEFQACDSYNDAS